MKFVERKIIFHGSYFADFYLEQSPKVQEKIEFVFHLIRKVERVSRKFLSQIEGTDGLYEIRIKNEYFDLKLKDNGKGRNKKR